MKINMLVGKYHGQIGKMLNIQRHADDYERQFEEYGFWLGVKVKIKQILNRIRCYFQGCNGGLWMLGSIYHNERRCASCNRLLEGKNYPEIKDLSPELQWSNDLKEAYGIEDEQMFNKLNRYK